MNTDLPRALVCFARRSISSSVIGLMSKELKIYFATRKTLLSKLRHRNEKIFFYLQTGSSEGSVRWLSSWVEREIAWANKASSFMDKPLKAMSTKLNTWLFVQVFFFQHHLEAY
jgi:hypothetical protein